MASVQLANCSKEGPVPSQPYKTANPTIKVKLSLCLTKHHAVKSYWGSGIYLHTLISEIDEDEWSASRPGRFNPGKEPTVSIG
jgi:hypothetical protein